MRKVAAALLLLAAIALVQTYEVAEWETNDDIWETAEIAVHIPSAKHDPQELAERHGYIYKGTVGTLEGMHLFEKSDLRNKRHERLMNATEVAWGQPQMARIRHKRMVSPDPNYTPHDPLYPAQWHHHNTETGVDTNVLPAWRRGFRGAGINVAIVDDGLEKNNADLSANYISELSWDVNFDRADPTPLSSVDSHGTMASCMAAAPANNKCGVGSAPEARVAGIKILGKAITDAGEAKGLGYKCEGSGAVNDIFSCSWGPPDDASRLDGPGPLAKAQIERCVKKGRQNKGTIYVWAGGNGRAKGDNVNYDGYANLRYTIPIGSMDYNRDVSYYSESGAALMAVTPGSGRTHRMTTCAYSSQCTQSFGGTSASSPLAAGILALVLQANPNLTWRDMQHIIARSSNTKFGDNWKTNGGHFKFMHRFGFGLLDADQAITIAYQWVHVPEEISVEYNSLPSGSIPNRFSKEVPANGITEIEHIEVHIVATSDTGRGLLEFVLISPSGMESRLQERHSDLQRTINWTYLTVAHWGEHPAGTWTLVATNTANRQSNARITSWSMKMYGFATPGTPPPVWSYRNTARV